MGLFNYVCGPYVLAGVAGLEPTLTESKSVELTNYSIPQYKSRRIYFGPEAGLEPAIALVLGKCLIHLNYSGSKNCCSRLAWIFIRASTNPYIKLY